MAPYNLRSRAVRPIPIHDRKIANISRCDRASSFMSMSDDEKKSFVRMSKEERKKYLKAQFEACGAVHIPPPRVSEKEIHRVQQENDLVLAEKGLSYLNRNDKDSQDAEYELVRPMASRFFLCGSRGGIYHSNFEAKLKKNDPDAEVLRFFLEVVEKIPGKQRITRCCPLGPSGSKAAATGPNGCQACFEIHHPKNVRFITGR